MEGYKMAEKKFVAKIYVKTGGSPVTVEVYANDSTQAKKIIQMRPEFKSFCQHPRPA